MEARTTRTSTETLGKAEAMKEAGTGTQTGQGTKTGTGLEILSCIEIEALFSKCKETTGTGTSQLGTGTFPAIKMEPTLG